MGIEVLLSSDQINLRLKVDLSRSKRKVLYCTQRIHAYSAWPWLMNGCGRLCCVKFGFLNIQFSIKRFFLTVANLSPYPLINSSKNVVYSSIKNVSLVRWTLNLAHRETVHEP